MSDLYNNLLKATSNIDDITTEKYATVTKINGNYCDAKEEDTGLEHTNVPIINGANLSVGDKAIIGFLNNSIYDVVCYGALDKTVHDDSKQDTLISGTNIKTINHQSLLGSGNITIEGGSNVDVVTSWEQTLSDEKVPSEKLVKNTLDGKAPTSHASSSSTYGLGTTANYGHVKTINGLTQSSHSDGTALSAYQGKLLKDAIDAKPDSSDIPTKTSDLTNDGADGTNVFVANNDSRLSDARTPTSHAHGNLTNDGKVGSTANYFVYTTTSGAITSKQKIGNITTSGAIGSTSGKPIITTTSGVLTTGSFGTSSGTFAEGNHTHSGYISTSSTTGLIKNDGTIMTSGTGSSNYAAGNHTHSGYVSTSDIADNLTTNDSTKVLSAKQGKALNDLIGAAITYINQ